MRLSPGELFFGEVRLPNLVFLLSLQKYQEVELPLLPLVMDQNLVCLASNATDTGRLPTGGETRRKTPLVFSSLYPSPRLIFRSTLSFATEISFGPGKNPSFHKHTISSEG